MPLAPGQANGSLPLKGALPKLELVNLESQQKAAEAALAAAEAERERRAKVIHADGEYQAAEKLSMAAATISREPVAITLRYLQTLTEIGTEKNTTIVFPLPMEFMKAFEKFTK